MTKPKTEKYELKWTKPEARFLREELAGVPLCPLEDMFHPSLGEAIRGAAASKGAPADYVAAGLLAAAGSLIGNARWVSPWDGWREPPIIWVMLVGLPSSGKSPALDAVIEPLRQLEAPLRTAAEAKYEEWEGARHVAELRAKDWELRSKKALKEGRDPEPKPLDAIAPPAPVFPRLVVNDVTVERLGEILSDCPRGVLQMRDELSGWLDSMSRYTAGSDRPFWLEAYGGRGYSLERRSRKPLTIEHLSVGVVGGIQPDRLKSLLFQTDDDGLLARFVPVWPDPVPVKRPVGPTGEALIKGVLDRLQSLELDVDPTGKIDLTILPFTEAARTELDLFREQVRTWETGSEGLMVSFCGKLSGLSARLALVLSFLDWAVTGGPEPRAIEAGVFSRVKRFLETYIRPMAIRTYGGTSVPAVDRSARHLVSIIQEKTWERFTTREVLRLERQGLKTADQLNPVLNVLLEGDCLRQVDDEGSTRGGRPRRRFIVNPEILQD